MSGIALYRLAIASIYFTAGFLGTTTASRQINNNSEGLNGDAPSGLHGEDYHGREQELMPAILLALNEGVAGENSLLAWSGWAEDVASSHRTPPALWVICTDTTAIAASVLQTPHVDPYVVSDESSWATVLENFISTRPQVWGVGLLGEGVLPHPGLMDSIESIQLTLFETLSPTAVLTRARSKGDIPGEERWLSDKYESQLWCNRAALEASVLTKAGLTTLSTRDVTLLHVLPRLIRDASDMGLVLVDGTHVIGSIFDAPPAPRARGSAKYPSTSSLRLQEHPQVMDGAEVYIGSLDFALAYDGEGTGRSNLQEGIQAPTRKTSSIVKAPWPPEYILETVAMNTTAAASKGLVLVSNVNCGYLDMATNFLMSVRNTSEAKVSHGFNRLILFITRYSWYCRKSAPPAPTAAIL